MPNYQNNSKKGIGKLDRNCKGIAFWVCTFLQVDWLSESANLHFQTSRYGLSDIIIHVHAVSILPLFHIDYEYNQTPRKKHTKKAPLKHRTKLNISTKTNTSQGHKLTENKKGKKHIYLKIINSSSLWCYIHPIWHDHKTIDQTKKKKKKVYITRATLGKHSR